MWSVYIYNTNTYIVVSNKMYYYILSYLVNNYYEINKSTFTYR